LRRGGPWIASGLRDRLDALVTDVLREHPPARFTLWRFTTVEAELAGVRLPARAPVLVDRAAGSSRCPSTSARSGPAPGT
jgi:hypothetical protein